MTPQNRAPTLTPLVCIALSLSACTTNGPFTNPLVDIFSPSPITTDYLGGPFQSAFGTVGVISTGAERRIILVPLNQSAKDKDNINQFCAEPPPDIGQAVATTFAASAKYSGAEGTLDRNTATAIASLLRRSQGLQYARDAGSFECVGLLNRVYDAGQFRAEMEKIRAISACLVAAELPFLSSIQMLTVSEQLPGSKTSSDTAATAPPETKGSPVASTKTGTPPASPKPGTAPKTAPDAGAVAGATKAQANPGAKAQMAPGTNTPAADAATTPGKPQMTTLPDLTSFSACVTSLIWVMHTQEKANKTPSPKSSGQPPS